MPPLSSPAPVKEHASAMRLDSQSDGQMPRITALLGRAGTGKAKDGSPDFRNAAPSVRAGGMHGSQHLRNPLVGVPPFFPSVLPKPSPRLLFSVECRILAPICVGLEVIGGLILLCVSEIAKLWESLIVKDSLLTSLLACQ